MDTLPMLNVSAASAGSARWKFDDEPSPDAAMNYLFETAASLLQQWPNTRYRNGHTIVPAQIPVGTLLYHGSSSEDTPSSPEWVATDPEHSFLFCRAVAEGQGCWQLTLSVTRPLNVLYFDGSSAAKIHGTMDAQDIIVWGEVMPDRLFDEMNRIRDLCSWGQKYNLDGFLRMEPDFEIMLCNFGEGVEVVSHLNLVSVSGAQHKPPPRPNGPSLEDEDMHLLPSYRALESGQAHNRFPGETRAKLDLTRLVSFYDADLFPSLVEARRGQERWDHRVQDIGQEGRQRLLRRLDEVLTGEQQVGSGVDWSSLIRVIVHRYGERIEVLQHMLNSTSANATRQVEHAHRYTTSMLYPYILHKVLPTSSSSTSLKWAAPTFEQCATSHTKIIGTTLLSSLTPSERTILGAVEGVLHGICRVLVGVWADGTVLQHTRASRTSHKEVILDWKTQIDKLVKWLDWSVWVKCKPECAFEETCYLPTWPWLHGAEWPGPGKRPPPPPDSPTDDATPETPTEKLDRRWGWIRDFSSNKVGDDYWRRPQPRCIRRVFPLEQL